MGISSRRGKREKLVNGPPSGQHAARRASGDICPVWQAQQVFLIFTVVPQIFGSQNAQKGEIAENVRTATPSRADAIVTPPFFRAASFLGPEAFLIGARLAPRSCESFGEGLDPLFEDAKCAFAC